MVSFFFLIGIKVIEEEYLSFYSNFATILMTLILVTMETGSRNYERNPEWIYFFYWRTVLLRFLLGTVIQFLSKVF